MKEPSERDVHRALNIVAAAAAGSTGTAFGLETVDAIAAAIPPRTLRTSNGGSVTANLSAWRTTDRSQRGSTMHSPLRAIRTRCAMSITPGRPSR
jgi:hypothetical protein